MSYKNLIPRKKAREDHLLKETPNKFQKDLAWLYKIAIKQTKIKNTTFLSRQTPQQ